MKLKFHQSISGTNFNVARGQELEIHDEAEAQRFIEAGIAEAVKDAPHTAELKYLRRVVEELAAEIADLRKAIEGGAEDGQDDEPAKKPAKKG